MIQKSPAKQELHEKLAKILSEEQQKQQILSGLPNQHRETNSCSPFVEARWFPRI